MASIRDFSMICNCDFIVYGSEEEKKLVRNLWLHNLYQLEIRGNDGAKVDYFRASIDAQKGCG